mmetsp:Transcript_94512/g.229511  ORF Transcript_94512/g.229511 Transcript_94512/m.229511 type:complete len:324 (+) Transcript_94512:2142-3113(+)
MRPSHMTWVKPPSSSFWLASSRVTLMPKPIESRRYSVQVMLSCEPWMSFSMKMVRTPSYGKPSTCWLAMARIIVVLPADFSDMTPYLNPFLRCRRELLSRILDPYASENSRLQRSSISGSGSTYSLDSPPTSDSPTMVAQATRAASTARAAVASPSAKQGASSAVRAWFQVALMKFLETLPSDMQTCPQKVTTAESSAAAKALLASMAVRSAAMVAFSSSCLRSVFLPLVPTRVSTSSAAVKRARHSGSAICSMPSARSGCSTGMNGATSAGFLTSLAMFSVMTAHLRLMAVFLSLNPRLRSGTVMERAEAVTVCTNVVPASE